ncbi:hypothetical protein SAMN04489724_2609 [Algoriphagus locisalis]|uniref:Uncharacterized protein n=1 Tax=Algoriphagus locisalis TaxID=305507 RepID=A0A1I7BQA5_9BACT|nr:hypothetical protein SAMN04489724_2609 [Algoriphagus locisalis]
MLELPPFVFHSISPLAEHAKAAPAALEEEVKTKMS